MAEALTNTITPPDITGVINQQFFIEPQRGPSEPKSYLDSFPESLYNKGLGSNLVALMYALLGPAGVGALRRNQLLARLTIEDHGLRTVNLDELYANPLSFARLASETYNQDTEGLLTNAQWEQVQESDKSYQTRATSYLKAVRAGGTLLGITLAASSGLDRAVEVIENYRALFDSYSDEPLELEFLGATHSTEEIILVPRQELAQNTLHVIEVEGSALSGQFALALPLGEGELSPLEGKGSNFSKNNVSTRLLPFNATFNEIREALEALPRVGRNIVVRGGPFPGHPVEVEFINELSDRHVPALLVTTNTLVNLEGQTTPIVVKVEQAGASADGQIATIPPESFHYAQSAIDHIKPVTTIVSLGKGPGITRRQIANTVAADSEFYEVIRYVTGNRRISWPPVDSEHWIVSGVEREAPVSIDEQTNHYTGFHNIVGASAYTDQGVASKQYESAEWPLFRSLYASEHVGMFSEAQRLIFPFLTAIGPEESKTQFFATNAPINPPEFLAFRHENIIGRSYPSSYIRLAEVAEREKFHALSSGALKRVSLSPSNVDKPPSETTPFWASLERTEGADFLEIDLGDVQGTNIVSFEASNKPFDLAVSYDILDAAPERRFIPVTYADQTILKARKKKKPVLELNSQSTSSVLSLGHDIEAKNPWRVVEINFNNVLGRMIFTRFIRIEFNRRTGERSPFTELSGKLLPFSIEVRNLRVGRNIS